MAEFVPVVGLGPGRHIFVVALVAAGCGGKFTASSLLLLSLLEVLLESSPSPFRCLLEPTLSLPPSLLFCHSRQSRNCFGECMYA